MSRLHLLEPDVARPAIETDLPAGRLYASGPTAGMRLWDAVRVPPFLDLKPDAATITLNPNRAVDSALRLLQAILYQALNDGMEAVELRMEQQSGACTLHSWGPSAFARRYWRDCGDETVDEEAKAWPCWWEMNAPPAFMFLPMMRVLLMMARSSDDKLALAHLPARAKQRRWQLHLTFPSAWTFRVGNLEGYFADPRQQAR